LASRWAKIGDRVKDGNRLDLTMVARGLADTRAQAQALILGGGVTVNGQVVSRPAAPVADGNEIGLLRQPIPYASRGGFKLRHALDRFEVDVRNSIALDVGASTGGFTDVLLQAGAARVYALDVGYGQLAWRLRNDSRVVVMERTNIRSVESLPEPVDVATVDVSFISLRLVLPVMYRLLTPGGILICLIKPQFEAGRKQVGKKGVVRDSEVWRQVLKTVLAFAAETDWSVRGIERSPIKGPAGNVEFLGYLGRDMADKPADLARMIDTAVPEHIP
jgi:23S rRNA (cytidine1920-2'-O)/16S rRNA (cytidine1409-2'-O)-methyltransferase